MASSLSFTLVSSWWYEVNDRCGWFFIGKEVGAKYEGVIGIYVKVDGKFNWVVDVGVGSDNMGGVVEVK